MADPTPDHLAADRVYSEGAVEWMKRRAGRRSISENSGDPRLDYTPIVFPPYDECRRAALVVCGAMANEVDPVAESKTILEALALPTIMRDGGDGRRMKTSGRHAKRRTEPLPIGYGEDDFGRPEEKKRRSKDATL